MEAEGCENLGSIFHDNAPHLGLSRLEIFELV